MTAKVLRALREWLRDVTVNGVVASALVPAALRWVVLRALGVDVGHSRIAGRCFFGGRGVTIGRGSFVNYGCFFDTTAPVHIGDRVSIGMQASFLTGTHDLGDARCRAGASVGRPITVRSGAWVGAGATVLPGVTIGEGAVVGAGALVTRDVEPHTVVAGVPARLLRTLD